MNRQQEANFKFLLDLRISEIYDLIAVPDCLIEEANSFSDHLSPELKMELEKKFGKENVDKILTLLEGA